MKCTLISDIRTITVFALIDTGATGYAFVDFSFARVLCDALAIEPSPLAKPKSVKAFNGKPAERITHGVYPSLDIAGHRESTAPLMITHLGNHQMILGLPWLERHGVIADFQARTLMFKPGVCTHAGALPKPQGATMLPWGQPLPSVSLPTPPPSPKLDRPRTILKRPAPLTTTGVWLPMTSGTTPPTPPPSPKPATVVLREEETVDIKMIGAAGLLSQSKSKDYLCISVKQMDALLDWHRQNPIGSETISALVESEPEISFENLLKRLPEEYREFEAVFKERQIKKLPPHREYDHQIEFENGRPSALGHCPLYAMSPYKLQKVNEYLEENLRKSFISPSKADYASPILFATKKDGGLRFCVDYRKLNALTRKNRYPIPLIQEIMAQLSGKKIFTRLDIVAAFNNLRMHPDSVEYTTFKTLFGMYQYHVMPFGLTGGPSSWQRYMNDTLFDYLEKFCSVYLDDILIYSDNLGEHKKNVRKVLTALQAAGLQVDLRRSEFHVSKTAFLGVIVGADGIEMNPKKVEAIVQWATSTNVKHVQSIRLPILERHPNLTPLQSTLTYHEIQLAPISYGDRNILNPLQQNRHQIPPFHRAPTYSFRRIKLHAQDITALGFARKSARKMDRDGFVRQPVAWQVIAHVLIEVELQGEEEQC